MALSSSSLVCRVGRQVCALPLTHVREVMRPLPVERLAGVSQAVRGLSVVRGEPVPVLSLSALLGGDLPDGATLPDSVTRFVRLCVDERHLVLAVDAVIDVHDIDPDSLQGVPALTQADGAGLIARLGTIDQSLLVLLSGSHLLSEADWARIRAHTGQGATDQPPLPDGNAAPDAEALS